METTTDESPFLVLPDNPELTAKLARKLEEYRERIAAYDREHPNQHPGFRARVQAYHLCRIFILERLFSDKKIIAWPLSKQFIEGREQDNPGSTSAFLGGWVKVWNVSWGVITDYCETGGANVSGGTGLR